MLRPRIQPTLAVDVIMGRLLLGSVMVRANIASFLMEPVALYGVSASKVFCASYLTCGFVAVSMMLR